MPLAFAACLLWSRGGAARWVIRAILPLAVCLGALLAYQHWLQATGRLPALYSLKNQNLLAQLCSPRRLAPSVVKHVGTALLYLGWFSLPVMVLVLPVAAVVRKNRRAFIIACCIGCSFVFFSAIVLSLTEGPLRTAGNIVMAQGFGPLTLRDVYMLNLPHLPTLGKAFWLALTVASVLGGAFLVGAAAGAAISSWPFLKLTRIRAGQAAGVFFLLCAGTYLFPILVIGGWDRYYIPALPFLLAGIAAVSAASWRGRSQARLALTLLLLGSLSLYAVCGTRDYLAWNRVRWTALNDLLAGGKVTAADIDGGFEFNGWYLYDAAYKEKPGKSWWWVASDSYLLAFGEMPGWSAIKEYNYAHWLPPYTGKIFVLKKESPQKTSPAGPMRGQPAVPPSSGNAHR